MQNLDIFDHFRERVVEAMEFAEEDLGDLKHRGDAWCARVGTVAEAWSQLARRLALVRMHLVQELETAKKEFGAERDELLGQGRVTQPGKRFRLWPMPRGVWLKKDSRS
jgi:hypothetical protein